MMRPQQKPNAAMQMGANRAAEKRADNMATLIEVSHSSATRIIELTELGVELRDRVAALEGQR
jgi:hypothetical protein